MRRVAVIIDIPGIVEFELAHDSTTSQIDASLAFQVSTWGRINSRSSVLLRRLFNRFVGRELPHGRHQVLEMGQQIGPDATGVARDAVQALRAVAPLDLVGQVDVGRLGLAVSERLIVRRGRVEVIIFEPHRTVSMGRRCHAHNTRLECPRAGIQ